MTTPRSSTPAKSSSSESWDFCTRSGLGNENWSAQESESEQSRRLGDGFDLDLDNEGARRLHERWGMTVEAESPSVPFMPDQRVLRMVKPL